MYEQYFPSEFGNHFTKELGNFEFYNPLVNPGINRVFAFVAFRFGHYRLKPWYVINMLSEKILFTVIN